MFNRVARLSMSLGLLAGLAGPGVAQTAEPAQGFALWVRAPGGSIQELLGSTVGNPQFVVGFRGRRAGIGLGLGYTAFRVSDKSTFGGRTTEDKLTATSFQLGPFVLLDIWRSTDSRTRGNLAAGLNLGRLSLTDQNQFIDFNNVLQTTETSTTGTLLGFNVGLGGEHFLHPHFGLGVEAGFRFLFAMGIREEGRPTGGVGLGASGSYSALRAIIVF